MFYKKIYLIFDPFAFTIDHITVTIKKSKFSNSNIYINYNNDRMLLPDGVYAGEIWNKDLRGKSF